jgi:aromatic ring-opening dioxygenase LigB subunit
MSSRYNFSLYIYNLHETINKLLNKQSGLTYEDIRERYEHFRSRCITIKRQTRKKSKKHKGCTIPLHKFKSKGIIKIVPNDTKCSSIEIDEKCNILND